MAPLEITIWDVNHGSAAYIKTPNDRHIVVDLGDDGNDFSPLQTLSSRGVKQLDAVVISHPHGDHMDDIYNFDLLSPQTLWRPRHLSEADIRKGNRFEEMFLVARYLEINQRFTSPLTFISDVRVPASFGGATFQVFSPYLCETSNLNNHSLVVVVSYAQSKMVIPGDNEAPSWKELLNNPTFVAAVKDADVLLASHHGRDAGYCAELFEAMGKPKLVVVSDGRFKDTSATSRYSNQATGWTVFDSAGTSDTRKCLTTRSDGHITIKFGWINDDPSKGPFLNVRTSEANMSGLLGRLLGGN
jgi:beta-lactamase superfamily II metal-dependent hydrolase